MIEKKNITEKKATVIKERNKKKKQEKDRKTRTTKVTHITTKTNKLVLNTIRFFLSTPTIVVR